MYTRNSKEYLTTEEIKKYVNDWMSSEDRKRIQMYKSYYLGDNMEIGKRVKDRAIRGKTPNNIVPTAYYTTVIDSMAGYMFNDIQYHCDGNYQDVIKDINKINNQEVKDMKSGIQGLAYNRSVELIYTDDNAFPRYTCLNPTDVILIYEDTIEPEIFCAIWVRKHADFDNIVDVIYAKEWQYWSIKSGNVEQREKTKPLFFKSCPVAVFNTQIIGEKSPFHQAIPYIDALDYLITGNSNEIERLVDALLIIGAKVKDEDLDHMDEWKVLQKMKADDRAEYLTKDMSPTFREYVSKLLIQEIHKHCHVVDWYNPDSGLSGAASGKALQTRLFDMDMYSRRIEKIYKDGIMKRLDLIGDILAIKGIKVEPVDVVLIRDTVTDYEGKVQALSNASFLSVQTRVEELGYDWNKEKLRIEEEAPDNTIDFNDNMDDNL